jgi:small subunit ribosomal protein S2
MDISITVKDLLDAGVHFGHQTKRWNPRSKPYIFDHRQGISIIDLGKTHALLGQACNALEDLVANGGDVLLVGTKRQAQEIIREAAAATGMPCVVNRWLGGTLTNFETIKKSIAKFKKYQQMETSGDLAKLPKKEESAIKREMARMLRNFDGITGLTQLPEGMFVVDVNYHTIAVAEANRVGMVTVGLVDTNSDPTLLTHPIPGNDDAVKSIRIIVDAVVAAIQSGLAQREVRRQQKGAADLKAVHDAQAAVQAAADAAAAPVAPEPEIDLDKIELPAGLKDVLVEEVEGGGGGKKKPVRAPARKIAAKASEE